MKITEAIKKFLDLKTVKHLADLYDDGMECQIQVNPALGESLEKEFTPKGGTPVPYTVYWDEKRNIEYKNMRIPYNANTPKPTFDLDREMKWPLEFYALGIGMTGWNWRKKVSKWFMYDFDSIVGHSDNHEARLSNEQLDQVRDEAEKIPWVTVQRSTAGHGLHFYVFVDDIKTETHTEHAALARAILGKMAAHTGFDFSTKIDVCGGNSWVWHKKYDRSTNGFQLIKQGEVLKDLPPNWRDHINVVKGKANRVECKAAEAKGTGDKLADLIASRNVIALDEEHKKLFKQMDEYNTRWYWDFENNRLCCHTHALKKAFSDLGLKGFFDTISSGSSEVNCFAFPLRKGAWVVRRFSEGVAEHKSWHQDGSGWTRCYLNKDVDFRTACRAYGGQEIPDKNSFEFAETTVALQAAELLGEYNLDVDPLWRPKKCILRQGRDGRLVIEIDHSAGDRLSDKMVKSWREDSKKRVLTYVSSKRVERSYDESQLTGNDDIVRHVVDEGGDDAGWVLNLSDEWVFEPLRHVQLALKASGNTAKEVEQILGSGIHSRWKLVNKPFQPEYPGDREWNRDGAKLAFNPDLTRQNLSHPHWDKVMKHCGDSLTSEVKKDSWCKANGITDGAQYLFAWLSCMVKEPEQPLPYLFFYGGQNVGKSAFHEAASLLLNKGYGRAEASLLSQSGFNYELKGVVLAVVEEIDFKESKQSINRLKDWVTSPQISIHEKGATPYLLQNYLHFVQVSNDHNACPIAEEDTRVTVSHVRSLGGTVIPKRELIKKLTKEAPDFITSLFKREYTPSPDRLRVPIIVTEEKRSFQASQTCPLVGFLDEFLTESAGSVIPFAEFYDKFLGTLEPSERAMWGKRKVGMTVPPQYTKGKMTTGQGTHLANVFWKGQPDPLRNKGFYTLSGAYLKLQKDEEA